MQEQVALEGEYSDRAQVVIARTFNAIGPRQSTEYAIAKFAYQISQVERGRLPHLTHFDLTAVRDFMHVDDTLDAFCRLLDHGRARGIYNVCSGAKHLIGDALERLKSMAKCDIPTMPDPEWDGTAGGRRSLVGDPGKAERETGWKRPHSFDEALADTLAYFRSLP